MLSSCKSLILDSNQTTLIMNSAELLSKTPFPFHEEWNELHITFKNGEVATFYVNNRIYDHSTDFKQYLIKNADSLDINVKNISSATLYLCNDSDLIKTVKNYTFL